MSPYSLSTKSLPFLSHHHHLSCQVPGGYTGLWQFLAAHSSRQPSGEPPLNSQIFHPCSSLLPFSGILCPFNCINSIILYYIQILIAQDFSNSRSSELRWYWPLDVATVLGWFWWILWQYWLTCVSLCWAKAWWPTPTTHNLTVWDQPTSDWETAILARKVTLHIPF